MLERYYRELLGFLTRSVKDRDLAADLTQESYVRVLAAQQAGRSVLAPRALLYRAARNLVIDQHRRAHVRGENADAAWRREDETCLDELAGPSSFEPEAALASQQRLAAMIATIERLPPRCREVFMLYKFDGLSYAEIAEQMKISPRTVEMQLQIAMQACWRCVDQADDPAHTPPKSRHTRAKP